MRPNTVGAAQYNDYLALCACKGVALRVRESCVTRFFYLSSPLSLHLDLRKRVVATTSHSTWVR